MTNKKILNYGTDPFTETDPFTFTLMKYICRLMFIGLPFLIIGCTTPYQSTGATGGFGETRLQENVFTVTFRGNGFTENEQVQDFAMLRCAEVTLENGFNYFSIADKSENGQTMLLHSGGSSQTYGMVSSMGNTAYGSFNTYNSPGYSMPVTKHQTTCTIVCFKEKPPEPQRAFDALYLLHSIRQKYKMTGTIDKIPLLGDLPLVGVLFQDRRE